MEIQEFINTLPRHHFFGPSFRYQDGKILEKQQGVWVELPEGSWVVMDTYQPVVMTDERFKQVYIQEPSATT